MQEKDSHSLEPRYRYSRPGCGRSSAPAASCRWHGEPRSLRAQPARTASKAAANSFPAGRPIEWVTLVPCGVGARGCPAGRGAPSFRRHARVRAGPRPPHRPRGDRAGARAVGGAGSRGTGWQGKAARVGRRTRRGGEPGGRDPCRAKAAAPRGAAAGAMALRGRRHRGSVSAALGRRSPRDVASARGPLVRPRRTRAVDVRHPGVGHRQARAARAHPRVSRAGRFDGGGCHRPLSMERWRCQPISCCTSRRSPTPGSAQP
jgi:hypothetical protein